MLNQKRKPFSWSNADIPASFEINALLTQKTFLIQSLPTESGLFRQKNAMKNRKLKREPHYWPFNHMLRSLW